MNQTKLESIIERILDMATGFIISVFVYEYYIIPSPVVLSGVHVVTIFTVISFIRGYFWRRFFNRGLHRVVHKYTTMIMRGFNDSNRTRKDG